MAFIRNLLTINHFFKEKGATVVLLGECFVYLSMIVITEVEIKDHPSSD